jgi:Zn finger protein HypA/HybF involved in hydrogenase expression
MNNWRYVCPYCGSTQTQKRRTHEKDTIGGYQPEGKYYCENCNSSSNQIVDKKTGNLEEI